MASPTRARRAVFTLVLLVLVGGTTLFVAEFSLRLSGRVTVQSIHTADALTYDALPGPFAPGQDVIERPHPKLVHHAITNALGFRGSVPSSLAKLVGIRRLLCIGDSFTYGSFVDDEATLPAQLQRRFAESRTNVEVINGGVGGTTIIDQIVFLDKAWPLEPDLVLLIFSENDVEDLGRHEPLHVSFAHNRELKSGFLFGFIYRRFADTALFNLALRARAYLANARPQVATRAPSEGEQARLQTARAERWRRYEAGLETFRTRVELGGASMVLATFPSAYRIDEKMRQPPFDPDLLEHIAGIAGELGIPVIPLLPALQRSGMEPEDLYLLPWDGHPAPEGYRIASTAIHAAIVGLFPTMR